MSKPRRLIITDVSGSQLLTNDFGQPLQHFQIDLTDIANRNACMPMHATVQQQCNLGCWHNYESCLLPFWPADE
jgi:hypothetical protein